MKSYEFPEPILYLVFLRARTQAQKKPLPDRDYNSWRLFFAAIDSNVTYKNIATTKETILKQIEVLRREPQRTVTFVATTAHISLWMEVASPFIERGELRTFTMTKVDFRS